MKALKVLFFLVPCLWLLAGSSFGDKPDNFFHYFTLKGDGQLDCLGSAVDIAGDINSDGYEDILVSAPTKNIGGKYNAGVVYVISGIGGHVLYSYEGEGSGDHLGSGLAGIGDINGDGYADFALGAPYSDRLGLENTGGVFVHSGIDGSEIKFLYTLEQLDLYGRAIAGLGDINGDQVPDFIVGAPNSNRSGKAESGLAVVYSGADFRILWQVTGSNEGEILGNSVACAGDLNGDGWPDLAIGVPRRSVYSKGHGVVLLYSGLDFSLIRELKQPVNATGLGADVNGAGDVNNDGYADVIAGAPKSNPGLYSAGIAVVYSGASGDILYQIEGACAFEELGSAVAGAGDINRDGYDDFIVGSPYAIHPIGGVSTGAAYVFSGADGSKLYERYGTGFSYKMGAAVDGNGDLNGDGYPDLCIGSPFASPNSIAQAGSVETLIYSTLRITGEIQLGQVFTYHLFGKPNKFYFLLFTGSLNRIPLGTYFPGDPRSLNVGYPVYVNPPPQGQLDGNGYASRTYIIPNNPGLVGFVFYNQFFTVPGPTFKINAISNPLINTILP